jgi:hypothetical protein
MQGLAGLLESTGVPKTVERLAYGEPLTNLQQANIPALRPETANALMTLLPVPSGANRAAMAAGRAGERMAERVVPQVMERGGAPAGLLDALSAQTVSPLTVYHGSPAKFSRFDPTKIGSGEGAQAFGYGHYVAESPETAKQYKETLKSKAFSKIVKKDRNVYDVVAPDGALISEGTLLGTAHKAKDAYDANAGVLYEIDLPDEQIARMLDYDKRLKDQPQEIQNAIKPLLEQTAKSFPAIRENQELTGYGLLQAYKGHRGGNAEAVSEALREAGIPGIRYLDDGSRGAGKGTQNFVVFPGNEDLLTILRRNGGLLD